MLTGSQDGLVKHWSVTDEGAFVDGVQVSNVRLADLALADHHAIRVKIDIKEDAALPGGLDIFGRGFRNYDQAIKLRLYSSVPIDPPTAAAARSRRPPRACAPSAF